MRLLTLIFGKWLFSIYSQFIRVILLIRGVKVGRRLYIEGFPNLTIPAGKRGNIVICDNVKIMGDIDLKVRENGKIIIENGCKIDRGVRLLAANNSVLCIGQDTNIGLSTVFNCGADITIGKKCLFSGFVYVQSSGHGIKKDSFIKDQPHTYGHIDIGDDVWIGCQTTILKGVIIGKGAVIGANSVVNKNIPEYAIAVGSPANVIAYRD